MPVWPLTFSVKISEIVHDATIACKKAANRAYNVLRS